MKTKEYRMLQEELGLSTRRQDDDKSARSLVIEQRYQAYLIKRIKELDNEPFISLEDNEELLNKLKGG